MKEEYFVGLDNSVDIRRNVLESSREMIHTLQTFDKLKQIREDKIKKLHQLKTVVRELDLLFSKLKTTLPVTHLRAGIPDTKVVQKPVPIAREELTELQKLEMQLKDVEQQLTRLS